MTDRPYLTIENYTYIIYYIDRYGIQQKSIFETKEEAIDELNYLTENYEREEFQLLLR